MVRCGAHLESGLWQIGWGGAGAAQITGLDDRDIVFMRFEGEGGKHCLPYFISLDREKRAVVVSIRGTLSLEDAMTGGALHLSFPPRSRPSWLLLPASTSFSQHEYPPWLVLSRFRVIA